jgi:hypothetical protein
MHARTQACQERSLIQPECCREGFECRSLRPLSCDLHDDPLALGNECQATQEVGDAFAGDEPRCASDDELTRRSSSRIGARRPEPLEVDAVLDAEEMFDVPPPNEEAADELGDGDLRIARPEPGRSVQLADHTPKEREALHLQDRPVFDGEDRAAIAADAQSSRQIPRRDNEGAVASHLLDEPRNLPRMAQDRPTARKTERRERHAEALKVLRQGLRACDKDDGHMEASPAHGRGELGGQALGASEVAAPEYEGDVRLDRASFGEL